MRVCVPVAFHLPRRLSRQFNAIRKNQSALPDPGPAARLSATVLAIRNIANLGVMPAQNSIVGIINLAHAVTQFPTVLETDLGKRQIFDRLLEKRADILSQCLNFFFAENAAAHSAFLKSTAEKNEYEIDLFRVLALLDAHQKDERINALLTKMGEANTIDGHLALNGVLKVLIDNIQAHLGEPKDADWFKVPAAPLPSHIAILEDPVLNDLFQNANEYIFEGRSEAEAVVSIGVYGVPGGILSGFILWLFGVAETPLAIIPALWGLWCFSKTNFLSWKRSTPTLDGKKVHRRYTDFLEIILRTRNVLAKIDTLQKIAAGQRIAFSPETEAKVSQTILQSTQEIHKSLAHLQTCLQDPPEGFFTIPWFPIEKIRGQKKRAGELRKILQKHFYELRELRKQMEKTLTDRGLQL